LIFRLLHQHHGQVSPHRDVMANLTDSTSPSRQDNDLTALGTGAGDVGDRASPPHPREEAFGYVCRRCSRCCHHKGIQVNPYEVARLARRFGQTAGEFRAASTRDGAGTMLRQTESGACVFLGPEGCTVHSDRPLVCRLYPLGRHVSEDGTEQFSRLEGHPQSAGEITDRGTIREFLQAQKAEAFMAAADDYFRWFCAARRWLDEGAPSEQPGPPEQEATLAADLIDVDAAIARHCAARGIAEPSDIEDRRHLHLEILYRLIADHPGDPHERS
jgi:Fe-S-cluster containining protein